MILRLLRRLLGWGPPEYGVLHVGVLVVALAAMVSYTSYSTLRTGLHSVTELQLAENAGKAMRMLPNRWKEIADQRHARNEISAYELQLEHARANRLRPQVEKAAVQLERLAERNAYQFAKSAALQAAASLAFSSGTEKLAARIPADRLPTLGARLTREIGESAGKKFVAGHGAQAVGDLSLSRVIDFFNSPTYLTGQAFKDRARGLDRLRRQIGGSVENELMAAHLMSVVQSLDKIRKEHPENYDAAVEARARKLDKFLSLTEASQAARKQVVKSQWKNARELSQWLHARVQATQKADEEQARVAQLRPSFKPYPSQGKAPLQVRFDAGATRGAVERFQWDFGDTFTGEGLIVAHIYKALGEYDVTLTVTGPKGEKQSTTRKVTVVAGEGTATVKVGLSPSKAKPSDTITIAVNPQITGMPEGEVTVTVTVDGREVLKYSHKGSLEGDLSRSLRHPLPKDIQGGEHVVQANLIARAGPKVEPITATGSRAFEVEGEAGGKLESFIGTWHGTARAVVTGPAGTAASVPVTLTVAKAGEDMIRVSFTSPDPSGSARDDLFTVKGNVATLNKHYFDQGMEYFERVTLTLVGEGERIIGRGTTEIWFTIPKRERADTGTLSLVAKKAE